MWIIPCASSPEGFLSQVNRFLPTVTVEDISEDFLLAYVIQIPAMELNG